MIRHLCLILVLLALHPPLHAQDTGSALSQAEIEQVRDVAQVPRERVLLYVKFLDERAKAIDTLFAHPRQPGREQDTHDLMEQFTSIANELDDNLSDYESRHQDIRKAIPKLLDATDRWGTELRSPSDDETYKVSRKLALQAVSDLRDDANEMTGSQKSWFSAHPPRKESRGSKENPPE